MIDQEPMGSSDSGSDFGSDSSVQDETWVVDSDEEGEDGSDGSISEEEDPVMFSLLVRNQDSLLGRQQLMGQNVSSLVENQLESGELLKGLYEAVLDQQKTIRENQEELKKLNSTLQRVYRNAVETYQLAKSSNDLLRARNDKMSHWREDRRAKELERAKERERAKEHERAKVHERAKEHERDSVKEKKFEVVLSRRKQGEMDNIVERDSVWEII